MACTPLSYKLVITAPCTEMPTFLLHRSEVAANLIDVVEIHVAQTKIPHLVNSLFDD